MVTLVLCVQRYCFSLLNLQICKHRTRTKIKQNDKLNKEVTLKYAEKYFSQHAYLKGSNELHVNVCLHAIEKIAKFAKNCKNHRKLKVLRRLVPEKMHGFCDIKHFCKT